MRRKIRLVSWNVNGLRAVWKKDFIQSFTALDADVFAVQETKLQDNQLTSEMRNVPGYQAGWSNCRIKKGYSGVGVYSRLEPEEVSSGIGIPEMDDEGRIIRMDFDAFVFFNVYFPNGQMSEERLEYKLDFYDRFFRYTDEIRRNGREVLIAGDFNTAHNEIDLKNPKANENRSGFLRIERDWLDKIIADGYVDTFRVLYPDTVKYSWWTYRFNARANNAGWRIDYFFASKGMMENGWIKDAFIETEIHGSDHCPVGLEMEIPAAG